MGPEDSPFLDGPTVKVARGGPLARTSPHMRIRWAMGIASCLLITRHAAADAPADSTEQTGVEEPARYGSEPARAVANAFLWPVRLMVDLVFLTTGTAGALLQNEQIVPRTRDFFFTSNGQIGLFPTLFLETGTSANVGARLIASIDPYAATLRAGYGGSDENVVEGRMRLTLSLGVPAVMSLEGLHDRRSGLGFLGLGQTPESDPRNQFRNGPAAGVFRERRERVVAGFGIRPLADLELLLSSSLTQRYTDDPADPDLAPTIDQAFLPSSTTGAFRTTRILYSELAVRTDTRVSRNGVATGALMEGYAGFARGTGDDPTRFGRAGFQMAAFLPFIRRSTVLSPKLVVDALVPSADGEIPFTEFTGQPTFRGFDNRRDYVSAVASLDYRWYLGRFFDARLFTDIARVAPTVSDLRLDHLRWAAGFGFDLHTSTSELGRIAVAGSTEGVHLLFTLGVPAGFGDRQHRD